VERWSADFVKGTAVGSAMARKEADGQSGRAVRADERRGGEERMDAFDVEGEDAAADDDEDAWRVARMVALFASSSSCWGEQRARRGLSARKSRRERKKENETQRKKRGREEAVATRSLFLSKSKKVYKQVFYCSLFFSSFFRLHHSPHRREPSEQASPGQHRHPRRGVGQRRGGDVPALPGQGRGGGEADGDACEPAREAVRGLAFLVVFHSSLSLSSLYFEPLTLAKPPFWPAFSFSALRAMASCD